MGIGEEQEATFTENSPQYLGLLLPLLVIWQFSNSRNSNIVMTKI
jgi:hypothetical protein